MDLDELDDCEIEKKLHSFDQAGFLFLPDWIMDDPVTPERVRLPSGKILDRNELQAYFKDNQLTIGNADHLKIVRALEYLALVDALDADKRYSRYEKSFIDEQDIAACRKKYPKRQIQITS